MIVDSFHVWLSPMGATCRVRVDGIENANWLLNRLRQSFIFESSEPVSDEHGSSCCSFGVAYCSPACYRTFEGLLAAIPQVELMLDPARGEKLKSGLTASRKTQSSSLSKVRRASKPLPSTPITGVFNWLSSKLSGAGAIILHTGS
jgi:hypothetical protein